MKLLNLGLLIPDLKNSITFGKKNWILSLCNNCNPWPFGILLWQLCYFKCYFCKIICPKALLLCKCSCFLYKRTNLSTTKMEMC